VSIKVCIDARIGPGEAGGVEQVILGMAQGFASLPEEDTEYHFLTYSSMRGLLSKHAKNSANIHFDIIPRESDFLLRKWTNLLPASLKFALKNVAHHIFGDKLYKIPDDTDLFQAGNYDLIHFPAQQAFNTQLPNIYHPHDLQHVHLPQCFDEGTRKRKDFLYKKFCKQASLVAVTSTWVKNDLISHLGLVEGKVRVIPLAPINESLPELQKDDLDRAKAELNLPEKFVFYPAQAWEHKNHYNLIAAAHTLREQHKIIVPLVFTGGETTYLSKIKRLIQTLNMKKQVTFLGYVTTAQIQALYKLSRCVVIPSKFEAASFPMWEAFQAETPVACSNVTSLPRQAGDAALIFDPESVPDMANCLRQIWEDENLQKLLIQNGKNRVELFSWRTTCKHFRACYRELLGENLSEEDLELISAEPIL
jgi:glycosyltransferase involved in cell wall biosynthesis